MKFAETKTDAERVEVLYRMLCLAHVESMDSRSIRVVYELLCVYREEIEATGYQGIELPGDIGPDGGEVVR